MYMKAIAYNNKNNNNILIVVGCLLYKKSLWNNFLFNFKILLQNTKYKTKKNILKKDSYIINILFSNYTNIPYIRFIGFQVFIYNFLYMPDIKN